jgi:hypothetical protein
MKKKAGDGAEFGFFRQKKKLPRVAHLLIAPNFHSLSFSAQTYQYDFIHVGTQKINHRCYCCGIIKEAHERVGKRRFDVLPRASERAGEKEFGQTCTQWKYDK